MSGMFWLADGPSTELGHKQLIDYAQPALLVHEPAGRLQGWRGGPE